MKFLPKYHWKGIRLTVGQKVVGEFSGGFLNDLTMSTLPMAMKNWLCQSDIECFATTFLATQILENREDQFQNFCLVDPDLQIIYPFQIYPDIIEETPNEDQELIQIDDHSSVDNEMCQSMKM